MLIYCGVCFDTIGKDWNVTEGHFACIVSGILFAGQQFCGVPNVVCCKRANVGGTFFSKNGDV